MAGKGGLVVPGSAFAAQLDAGALQNHQTALHGSRQHAQTDQHGLRGLGSAPAAAARCQRSCCSSSAHVCRSATASAAAAAAAAASATTCCPLSSTTSRSASSLPARPASAAGAPPLLGAAADGNPNPVTKPVLGPEAGAAIISLPPAAPAERPNALAGPAPASRGSSAGSGFWVRVCGDQRAVSSSRSLRRSTCARPDCACASQVLAASRASARPYVDDHCGWVPG